MRSQAKGASVLCALSLLLLLPALAWAGSGGAEFQQTYTTLTGWMTGYLGRIIAIVFILIGLVAGATRQSLMGFVLGVAAGLGLFLAPGFIDSVVTATLPLY